MAGTRGTRVSNTQAEYLSGLLQDIAYAQSLPDADLEFLTSLQQLVLTKIREPMEAAMQASGMGGPPAAAGPMGGGGLPPMGGGPPGMGGGTPPGGGVPQGPGVPGLRNGIAMPPVDELRRMLGANSNV